MSESGQRAASAVRRLARMDARRDAEGSPAKHAVYHGWRVVAVAFVVALFGWGLGFYGPGIYLVALNARHGWSTAAISSAITVYYVLGAALTFFTGSIFERIGVRRVVMTGAVAMAAGVVLLAVVTQSWQVYAAFAVMAVGWAAMSGAAINIIVAPWFDRRRGLAVSLALNGASAGGVIFAPLLIALIDHFGFHAALSGGAGLMLVIVLPAVALVLRPKRAGECDHPDRGPPPAQVASAKAGAAAPVLQLSAVLRSRNFHTIAIPFALGLAAQVGFLTHQVAYLAPIVGVVAAGWAVSLTTFTAVAARLVTGLFVDHVDRRLVACGNFCVQVVGMGLLISNASVATLYMGCALFGLGVGNMITLPALIVQQEFPKDSFARIVSWVIAISQFTFAFGPALLGYLQRLHGSYTAALFSCLAMQAAAALVVVAPVLGRIGRGRSGDAVGK